MPPLTIVEIDDLAQAGGIHAPDRFDVTADRAVGESDRHHGVELGQRAQPVATSPEKPANPSDFTT